MNVGRMIRIETVVVKEVDIRLEAVEAPVEEAIGN